MTDIEHMPAELVDVLKKGLKEVPSAEKYLELRDECARILATGTYPYTTFHDLSYVLKVRMFPYDDDGFFNEAEYARHDNIGFTIGDSIVRMALDQGTLFKKARIHIEQN